MDELIGVMSKRSVSLAAAGDAGRFECDVESICRGAVEDDLFSLYFCSAVSARRCSVLVDWQIGAKVLVTANRFPISCPWPEPPSC
jgi:hypothetical protein